MKQRQEFLHVPSKMDRIIELLSMPKISVGVEKTIQENQYEPKKVSVFISQSAENIDPARIKAMITVAEQQVLEKLGRGS